MNELKPCPFCGSIEVQAYWTPDEYGLDGTKYWGAGCKRCVGMIEECFSTKEKAIKAWNTRHPHL